MRLARLPYAGPLCLTAFLSVHAAQPASAENIVFPASANICDVTDPEYGATPNDKHDDTEAFRKALTVEPRNRLIYVPNGEYLVSDTLPWGRKQTRQILQGQSEGGVVIRLRDNAPTFQNPREPKAVIWTGKAPAQRFRNAIRNLTVDVGKGNPGAIGVQFIANNQGGVYHVTIRSSDPAGAGAIGLDLGYTNEQGPCLLKDVTVEGFEIGLKTAYTVDSVVAEHITLRNQRRVALLNDGQCLSLRGLISENAVPAVVNKRGQSLLALIDARLDGRGDAAADAAIHNEAGLFARNVRTSGYAKTIVNDAGHGTDVVTPEVREFVSHDVLSLFPTPPESLNLPIEETPQIPWDPPEQWVSVAEFAPQDERDDWTDALQQAIDSGHSTVFFPHRERPYKLTGTVRVRGAVQRIIGLETNFEMARDHHPTFIIEDGEAPAVIIERFDWLYTHAEFIHQAPRTLVLSAMAAHEVSTAPGAGDLFLEDMVFGDLQVAKGTKVWARQLNLEGWQEPKSHNAGGQLWILGLKTETDSTAHMVTDRGQTEVIGGFLYANKAQMQPKQMFVNNNSNISFTVGESVGRREPFDIIIESRTSRLADAIWKYGRVRRILRHGQAYARGGGSMIPLYTGYWSPDEERPAPPREVQATAVGTGRIKVQWEHTGSRADGFIVEAVAEGATACKRYTGSAARSAILTDKVRAGQQYKVRVTSFNGRDLSSAAETTVTVEQAAAVGAGEGLEATYFAAEYLEHEEMVRVDSSIAFDFTEKKPIRGAEDDRFSIRWCGMLEPRYSEPYVFRLEADDGGRLWIDGALSIDAWGRRGRHSSRPIELTAGKRVPIRVEYVQRNRGGSVHLSWQSTNQSLQVVPSSQCYASSPDLPTLAWAESTATIWENGSRVTAGIVRQDDTSDAATVKLEIRGTADAGVDFELPTSTIVLGERQHQAEVAVVALDDGKPEPTKVLELFLAPSSAYFASTRPWTITLKDDDLPPVGKGEGLQGQYFNQKGFEKPALTRTDPTIDFHWHEDPPAKGVEPRDYSIRWTGYIEPLFSETYTFETKIGEYSGARVSIDGNTVIDTWDSKGVPLGRIALTAGKRIPITVEYEHRHFYGSLIHFYWSSGSQFRQIVPATQLYAK